MARKRFKKRLKFLLLTQLSCSGCFSATPFQSARVIESGQQTGSMSIQRSRPRDDPHGQGWTAMEFGTRVPLGGGRTDLGINGSFVSFDPPPGSRGRRAGGVLLGLGPKFELINDVLSIEIPARVTFAGALTLYTTHIFPRAIVSLPIADSFEVNLSATKFLVISDVENTPWGYSVGLAIGKRGGAIFRPEIGVLDYPEGSDMIQFGIAYTPEFRTPARIEASTERTPQ